MNLRCPLILTVTCLALPHGGAHADPAGVADAAAIERAVLDVSDQMTAAGEARDAVKLFSYILENDKGVIVQNGSVLQTRSEALAQTQRRLGGLKSIAYRWHERQVTVISPDVALLVAAGESTAVTGQDQSFTTPFVQTLVFVQRQGQWRVLQAHHSTPLPR